MSDVVETNSEVVPKPETTQETSSPSPDPGKSAQEIFKARIEEQTQAIYNMARESEYGKRHAIIGLLNYTDFIFNALDKELKASRSANKPDQSIIHAIDRAVTIVQKLAYTAQAFDSINKPIGMGPAGPSQR